jgi:predicted enzyme involved in methoxymalonyl-ACP biosynthesis
MNYLPKVGDIIKMRSWHGIVLEVYRNEAGKMVLQVQTVRNIFRKLGPELIEVDLAPEQIVPASLEDLRQEISLHQEMLENSLKKFLSYAEQTSYSPRVEQAIDV